MNQKEELIKAIQCLPEQYIDNLTTIIFRTEERSQPYEFIIYVLHPYFSNIRWLGKRNEWI